MSEDLNGKELRQFCRVAHVPKEHAPKTLLEAYLLGLEHGRFQVRDILSAIPSFHNCQPYKDVNGDIVCSFCFKKLGGS